MKTSVSSSTVKAVEYEPVSKHMIVHFHSGDSYVYHDVTPDTHAQLLRAKSIGSHLHQHIKDTHKSYKI